MILINYKEEIEFYLSHAEYIKLVDDPSKKDMYESKPTIFYQRKKASQLASEEASGLVSKLKSEQDEEARKRKEYEEYLNLKKEYKDSHEKLIAEYKYPTGKSKQDPEFKAIERLINELNANETSSTESGGDEQETLQFLFKPTYIDKEFEYWQVFEADVDYNNFLLEQYKKIKEDSESRTMSKPLKTDYDKIKSKAQGNYTRQKNKEEAELAAEQNKLDKLIKGEAQKKERIKRSSKKFNGGSKNRTKKLQPPIHILTI